MWQVIQHRWIRNSNQNFSNLITEVGRKKQAKGELKANLHSHIEMLHKHEYDEIFKIEDAIVDWENFSLTLLDEVGPVYEVRYEMVEVAPEPKKPKINLIAELEKLLKDHESCIRSDHCYDFWELKAELEDLIDKVKGNKNASY